MFGYVLKRVLAMIPTLLGITFLTFLIITCAPGDPVAMQIGGGGAEGGESQTKKGDAIRAKRKLLGMMEAEHTVRTWRTEPPELPRPSSNAAVSPQRLERTGSLGELGAWARSLAADTVRGRAYVGTAAGRMLALAIDTGEAIEAFAPEPFVRTLPDGGTEVSAVWALALSPDGSLIAAADAAGRLFVLGTADGRRLAENPGVGRTVRDLAFLPTGDAFVAAYDDGRIRLHDARSAEVRKEFERQALFVSAVEPAPDGKSFYSLGYDRKVRRFEVATGTSSELGEISAAGYALALSADGARLAAGGDDRGITVFDVSAGTAKASVVESFPGAHARTVSSLAFTPDGRLLVSASKDGGVRVWRLEDGAQLAQAPDNTNGEVFSVALSADGATLWTASECDRATPVWKRYLTWLGKLVRLDFDRSFIDDEKVIDKIWEALPVTLGLSALSIFLTYLVSIPVGVVSAVRRGRPFDRIASVTVFLLWSIPSFFAATLLIQQFSSRTHLDLFPSYGLRSQNYADLSLLQQLSDRGAHLVLPMICLTYATFAGLTQYMRTSMLETVSQDYVRTARAKGLAERIVIFKHALRNSLVTMVTLIGTLLPAMIGGSIIIERIFTIRGMGYLGFTAITERDYPVIMAVTTMSAVLTLLGMLVSDILYAVVDPRISHK